MLNRPGTRTQKNPKPTHIQSMRSDLSYWKEIPRTRLKDIKDILWEPLITIDTLTELPLH